MPNIDANLTTTRRTDIEDRDSARVLLSNDLIGLIISDAGLVWSSLRRVSIAGASNWLRQRPRAILVASALAVSFGLVCLVASALAVSFGLVWVGAYRGSGVLLPLQLQNSNQPHRKNDACSGDNKSWTLAQARSLLLRTANPSLTMMKQGPEFAINRLHPQFAIRLAAAVLGARDAGLSFAGVHSAYRPPALGVGRFSDKFDSLHAYGLAVDMDGIGRPGSAEARQWHELAARHGVICPYGVYHKTEWNHCQATALKKIEKGSPLRETITADGPLNLAAMFEAGDAVVESLAHTAGSSQQSQLEILATQAPSTCSYSLAADEVPMLSGLVPGNSSVRESGKQRI
jgi:hypothetical protein